MSVWNVDVEPRQCTALSGLVTVLHVGAALLPWAAGCVPWLAAVLTGCALAALPAALRAVPGPRCPLLRLRCVDGRWVGRLAGGGEAPAAIASSSRVLPGIAFCRVSLGGRTCDWWIPRRALPAADFRRLKVALRCSPGLGHG